MSRKSRSLILLLSIAMLGLDSLVADARTPIGSVTITGAERSSSGFWDTGTITATFNGIYVSISYGQFSTPASVASGLAAMISNSCSFPVYAQASGAVINFYQKGTDQLMSAILSSASSNGSSGPSFAVSGAGSGGSLDVPAAVSVEVTPSPTLVAHGDAVEITVDVYVNDPEHVFQTALSASCTADGYTFPALSSITSGNAQGGASAGYYSAAQTVSLTANSTDGPVTINCTATSTLGGSSIVGQGQGSFTVSMSKGTPDDIPNPTITPFGTAQTESRWTLTGTVYPSRNKVSVQGVGYGVTGQVSDLSGPAELLDCDGYPNDNLESTNATVEANDPTLANNQILFTWAITSYDYGDANPCDQCEQNPDGHYPLVVGPPSVNPSGASWSESCQSPIH